MKVTALTDLPSPNGTIRAGKEFDTGDVPAHWLMQWENEGLISRPAPTIRRRKPKAEILDKEVNED